MLQLRRLMGSGLQDTFDSFSKCDNVISPFQPSITFHIETSYYMKRNTGLKLFKKLLRLIPFLQIFCFLALFCVQRKFHTVWQIPIKSFGGSWELKQKKPMRNRVKLRFKGTKNIVCLKACMQPFKRQPYKMVKHTQQGGTLIRDARALITLPFSQSDWLAEKRCKKFKAI